MKHFGESLVMTKVTVIHGSGKKNRKDYREHLSGEVQTLWKWFTLGFGRNKSTASIENS